MLQQVNLLKAFAPPEKTVFPASMIVKILALLIVVLVAMQVQIGLKKTTLEKQYKELSSTKDVRANELATLSAQLPNSDSKETIQNEVDELIRDVDKKSGLLKIVERANKTFSAYLYALAVRTLPGIWIKEITIDQTMDDIALLGRTLNSNLVPLFLAELAKEPAFANVEFKQLKLVKPLNNKLSMAFALRTQPKLEEKYIFAEDAQVEKPDDEESAGTANTASEKVIGTLLKGIVSGGGGGAVDLPSVLGGFLNKGSDKGSDDE